MTQNKCVGETIRALWYYKTNRSQKEWTTLYVYIILLIFPFYATNQYFRLLRDRTAFFTIATMALIVVTVFLYLKLLIMLLWECLQEGGQIRSLFKVLWQDMKEKRPECVAQDRCFMCFLIIATLSMICSKYRMAAFWGDEGRYQGLFLWLLYGAAYFMLSRYVKPNIKMLQVFLVGGVISALWGIANFLGMDPFHWLALVKEEQKGIFVSSYGNINTYTAAMSLFMAIAGVLYIMKPQEDNKKNHAWLNNIGYLTAFYALCIALITGRSDNAALAIGAFFIITPFFTWENPVKIKYHSHLYVILLFALVTSAYLSIATTNPYIQTNDGILLKLCNNGKIMLFLCLTGVLWLTISNILAKKQGTYTKKIWAFFLIGTAVIGGVTIVVFREHLILSNSAIGPFLHFSDSWGSHRGYIWRAAVEEFWKFSLKDTLIGTGPETFGLMMKELRYEEMKMITGQVFDSPHNEFLQYLFTTGVLGTISYYGFLLTGIANAFREYGSIKKAAGVAVAVYVVVSFVNISVPITQPYIIILTAFLWSSAEKQKNY